MKYKVLCATVSLICNHYKIFSLDNGDGLCSKHANYTILVFSVLELYHPIHFELFETLKC